MTHPEETNDTLPQIVEGERKMSNLIRKYPEYFASETRSGPSMNIEVEANANLDGVLGCVFHPNVRMPISFRGGSVEATASILPANESPRLLGAHDDIRQDIEEAERCHFNQPYKAAGTMCRRANQLAFEHLLAARLDPTKPYTLGILIGEARTGGDLEEKYLFLAGRVNEYGNDATHHRVELDERDVGAIIYDSVQVLNEIYKKKPA